PSGEEAIAALRAMASTTTEEKPVAGPPGDAVKMAGSWTVRFVPSPELVARGIKVDTIRARLLEIGKIVSVAPQVLPGGGISFDFNVQTDDEASLAGWKDDGVSYEPITTDDAELATTSSVGTEL